jgi:hypothetical protein
MRVPHAVPNGNGESVPACWIKHEERYGFTNVAQRRNKVRPVPQNVGARAFRIRVVRVAYPGEERPCCGGELVDQLFDSTEKRLARILLLPANFGRKPAGANHRKDQSGSARRDDRA